MHRSMIVVVCFVCLCDVITGSWNQAHRDQLVKIHNDYRKGVPGACEMNMIKYDNQLETEAKAWAKKCVFEHQQKGRGENIAWTTKYTSNEAELLKLMAKMWYDEVKDYTYGQYGCGEACHYTQVVWSKTTNVGCYAEDCAHLQKGGDNAYFLVCFYNPPGNYEGENPYKKNCGGSTTKKVTNHQSTGNANTKTTANHNSGGSSNKGTTNNNSTNGDDGWPAWSGWSSWSSTGNTDSWDW